MRTRLLLFLAVCLFGCESDTTSPQQPMGVAGSWIWISSSGGHSGQTYYPVAGEEQIIQFTSNGSFSLTRNDTLMETATYVLNPNDTLFSLGDTSVTLTNRTHLQPITYFSLEDWSAVHRSGDSLWFDDSNGDGFVSLYMKIIVIR